jgi:signal transduction histidine kinase
VPETTTEAGPTSASHPAVAVSRVPRWTTRLDVALALALALWGVGEALVIPELRTAQGFAFAVASTLPLVVRRRFPVAVMVVICAMLLLQAWTGGAGASFTPFPGLLVATFTVAVQVPASLVAVVAGSLPVGAMLGADALGFFGDPGIDGRGSLILVFFVGATWTGGRLVRQRALAVLEAEARVDEAEQEARRTAAASRTAAAAAVEAERARIARELHDVVAHAVSVVVLQTGAAEQLIDSDVDRARRHVGLARRTAAEAMSEMRHLLDVLREGEAVYVPQPGLGRVPELVGEAREAGLPVQLVLAGRPGDTVPDGPSLAVYRVVQESLTNVLRHAPGADTLVTVDVGDGCVTVTVANAAPPTGAVDTTDVGGHGLVGMRERIRVYGGALETGPQADGGWRVRAVVPWASA